MNPVDVNPVALLLRETAENIREGGFSPYMDYPYAGEKPNCFIGHMPGRDDVWVTIEAEKLLRTVVGVYDYDDYTLINAGWKYGVTDDAAAACEIAADIAEATADA